MPDDRARPQQRGSCDRDSGRLQGFAPPKAGIEPRDSAPAESRLAKQALVLDWDGTVTARDTLHMAIERFGDLDVFRELEEELGRQLTLDEVIATEMATMRRPLDEVVGWLARARPGAAGVPRARRGVRPVDRLGRVPRADRADPRAGGHRRAGRREPRRGRSRRLARDVPGRDRPAPSAASGASGARSRRSARSRTSETASPIAASRSRRSGSSPARASRAGWTGRASRTSRSGTSTTCSARWRARSSRPP